MAERKMSVTIYFSSAFLSSFSLSRQWINLYSDGFILCSILKKNIPYQPSSRKIEFTPGRACRLSGSDFIMMVDPLKHSKQRNETQLKTFLFPSSWRHAYYKSKTVKLKTHVFSFLVWAVIWVWFIWFSFYLQMKTPAHSHQCHLPASGPYRTSPADA